MVYLDFDLDLREHDALHYQVLARGPVGESNALVAFPFTDAELENHLLRLENAILRSVGRRRKPQTEDERVIQTFGQQLFDFLLHGDVRTLYYECLREAGHRQQGVRLRLHIQSPALALLPWEFLYDPRRSDYVCLDSYTPLVRYLDLPQRVQPLSVAPPLRILGIVASPNDLQELNVALEQANLERALHDLLAQGLVELTWLPGDTWRDLQRAQHSTAGPWHVIHFIGHGGFDATRGEGVLYLADEQGRSRAIGATQLSRLFAGQRYALRLVVLNACEGASGGRADILSSTAATLVLGGLPAVLAMQYEITDVAAVELAQSFYEALADGLPVDTAVAEARNAISLANEHSLEWGTPVLYLRSPDGYLFDLVPTADSVTPHHAGPTAVAPHATSTPAEQSSAARTPVVESAPHAEVPLLVQFDWVPIPAGSFQMGSDKEKDKAAYDDETPPHLVSVADFKIGREPVTVAQFEAFVAATGYKTTAEEAGSAVGWTGKEWADIQGAYWAAPRGPESHVRDKADHPVTCVSWHDANAFCAWATEVYRAAGQGIEIRLPSEAEWEKAARGTDGRIWPWGNEPPDKARCNFVMNVGDTTPVGCYPSGAHGLHDMAGNVWEWTSSLFQDYPYKANDRREDPAAAGRRVVRGGSFVDDGGSVRCAYRVGDDPGSRDGDLGFRVLSPGS